MAEDAIPDFRDCGYCVSGPLLAGAPLEAARDEAARLFARANGRGGVRSVLGLSSYFRAVADGVLAALARQLLGPGAVPVKATLFDKTAAANWKVPWHQDLTIAVRERRPAPGFGPWSVKDGVVHVQAPVSVLQNMVAVRLHLDDTPADNGALRILPGTHRLGRIDGAVLEALRMSHPEVVCAIDAGRAMVLSPLLLHASSAARVPGHRRVLHVEYTSQALPEGLDWAA